MSAAALREIRRLQAQGVELQAIWARQQDVVGATPMDADTPEAAHRRLMAKYVGKPSLFAKEVLGLHLWDKIADILDAAEKPPYRTNVKSGHKIGKTNGCAAFINYAFEVYDPGVIITTGASYDAMKDTVWSEVRMQRMRANLRDYFIGPVAPEMRSSPEHWAKLFSVNDSTSFQGKHRSRMVFLFDECVGVEKSMFTVAETMFKEEPGFVWICFCNPTDVSSQIYVEEQLTRHDDEPKWRSYSVSSLDHPNIVKQREARAQGIEIFSSQLPIPGAVSISQVDRWVQDWCQPIDQASANPEEGDFEWIFPEGKKSWWRPQMDWEARCLGCWPKSATASVWSDYQFGKIIKAVGAIPVHLLPELGADVARFGDDKSTIHTRWGTLSLTHASRQGLTTMEMTGWVIEVARWLAEYANKLRKAERAQRPVVSEYEIPLKIDDDGVGGGVVDRLNELGYNVVPVRAGSTPMEPARYLNKRSELWFSTVKKAVAGEVCFCERGADGKVYSRLDRDAVQRLKLQAMAPKWTLSSKGHRVVEFKKETKKRLGFSPDDMDALNLAYYELSSDAPKAIDVPVFDNRPLGPPTMSDDAAWNDQQQAKAPSRRARFGR